MCYVGLEDLDAIHNRLFLAAWFSMASIFIFLLRWRILINVRVLTYRETIFCSKYYVVVVL